MKAEISVKFPCGYEFTFLYSEWHRTIGNIPDMPTKCPLHGKDCHRDNVKGGKK